jgi:hypothetical protein
VFFAAAQERPGGQRIDVDAYAIDMRVTRDTQPLNARAARQFERLPK